MKLIFLGPPGAGKGTLAKRAVASLGLPHVSTGDLFRAAIREGSELGLKVKGIIDSGSLVPDDLTIALVRERLAKPDAAEGWILDGFPRTIPQALALDAFQAADRVVDFELDDGEVLKRLSSRRYCPSCSATYNVAFLPPKKDGLCDACGGALATRDDDRIEAVTHRLDVYRRQTAPLIDHYRAQGLLLSIDASPAPEDVLDAFLAVIGS